MKRLLILSGGEDTAGCGTALKRAFDACAPGWEARAVCRRPSPYGYPIDIIWPRGDARTGRRVAGLFAQADVVHVMERPEIVLGFPDWQRKTIIVHHLGTRYRRDPRGVSAACQAIGAVEVADMHDLLLLPHVRWLPTPQDLDGLAGIRAREYQPSDRIRIAHAPTRRAVKGTDRIIPVVERLAGRYPIDFDLIEGVSNAECLVRKARADILIDALSIGYAVNAVESMAMGVPVICGLERLNDGSPADLRARLVADFGEPLPFLEATEQTLGDILERLILNPALRVEWGERGRAHVRRYHAQAAVVESALAIYAQAGRTVAA